MPQRTRRAGVKKRLRILKYAFENSPAKVYHGAYLGINSKIYYDAEYEPLFAAHKQSDNDPESENYDPQKAWPFILKPIDTSRTAPVPAGYNLLQDPRIRGYSIASDHSILDKEQGRWKSVSFNILI